AQRAGNTQTGSKGRGVLKELSGFAMRIPGLNDWSAPFRLHDDHAWTLVTDPAHLLHFVERFAHPDQADAAASPLHTYIVQRSAELFPELVAHSLLAFDTVGLLQRRDVVPTLAIFAFGNVFAAVGNQAIELDDLRAKCLAFNDVGRGCISRHDDDCRQSSGGR